MNRAPHLLVFDGFADWEAAYACAELRRSGKHQVITVGFSGEPVISMGGLCVLPDLDLAELRLDHCAGHVTSVVRSRCRL